MIPTSPGLGLQSEEDYLYESGKYTILKLTLTTGDCLHIFIKLKKSY